MTQAINGITRDDVNDFGRIAYFEPTNLMEIYQEIALKSAVYPGKGTPLGLIYVALKGAGEAGEFAEHVGKAMRDDSLTSYECYIHGRDGIGGQTDMRWTGKLTPERRDKLILECGDELWYLAAKCRELGVTLSEVALMNLEKLCDRTERDVLRGSGDDR